MALSISVVHVKRSTEQNISPIDSMSRLGRLEMATQEDWIQFKAVKG